MPRASIMRAGPTRPDRLTAILPGVTLSGLVAATAYALEAGERQLLGRSWIEPLVLAIIVGTAVRSLWTPSAKWRAGIVFSAKTLLEIAIVALGAGVSGAALLGAGAGLLIGIPVVVALAVLVGFGIGRVLGLPSRMAMLVACGNAICGNSAIAAVAPVIGADSDDVAASIAFTAVLGIGVVLALPVAAVALGASALASGALCGLTVYAVPQVLAAAAPLGPVAIQMGTLVKLIRVLMLGPVCLILSLVMPADTPHATSAPRLDRLVPWFILGFLALVLSRTVGLVPDAASLPLARLASVLTVMAMAALGLGVDLRAVTKAGGRVTAAVILSLLTLAALSLLLLHALRLL